ncbi:MAG: hypothetical protein LBV44_04255 [Methylobacillus sp.]|jgi:outer membrane protein assembly factor BamE (lipoprotein component of BamABCDE complex)|nr:hypothetical protein [Methylobacillus sp.]
MHSKLIAAALTATLLVAAPSLAAAGDKDKAPAKTAKAKTYDEGNFMRLVNNKTKQQVLDAIGEPARKQLAVKPTDAETVIGRPLDQTAKPTNVEMWYYINLVSYEKNKTYKTTELTFVNGRVSNMAFFNTP